MKNFLPPLIRTGCFTLVLSIFLISSSTAQHFIIGSERAKIEAGLNFGPTFFLGDLGGHAGKGTTFVKDVNMPLTKLMKGAFLAIYPTEWLGFRIAAQYTYIEGRDEMITTKGNDELYRKQRNLDFKSDMFEAYTAVEIFPFMLLYKDQEDYAPRIRPYGFIGVGMFKFNPKGSLTAANGDVTWHDLYPLHTEGQGFPEYPSRKTYSLKQVNIPMGGGLKYFTSGRANIAFELLYRKTFTDYIDDVSTSYIDQRYFDQYLVPEDALIAKQINDKAFTSYIPGSPRFTPGVQRGNPKNMDAYFSFALKFGLRLGGGNGIDKSAISKMRCPVRF